MKQVTCRHCERRGINRDNWYRTDTGYSLDAAQVAREIPGSRFHYTGLNGVLAFEYPEDLAQFKMTYTKPKSMFLLDASSKVISIDKSRSSSYTAIEIYRYYKDEWENVS